MKATVIRLVALAVLVTGLALSSADRALSEERGDAAADAVTPDITSAQRDCDLSFASTSSTAYVTVPNSSVTVNNGTVARNCVIQFSSEALTGNADERILIRFKIDGGSCTAYGPEYFHSGTETETHTAIGVTTLSSGSHTIQPCYRTSNGSSSATLEYRCLTVECRTK